MNQPHGEDSEEIRVQFVEDYASIAQMYKFKLEVDGYRLDVAGDGELALEMALSSLPDMIFLDIRCIACQPV